MGVLAFWLCGYGFAFGVEKGGFIGKRYFFGIEIEQDNKFSDWSFQFTMACTAATIVSGSLAERITIGNYLVFSILMIGFIYPVVVAWTWGGGWLDVLGYQDSAGSGVIHLVGGVAGFVGSFIIGPRIGRFDIDSDLYPPLTDSKGYKKISNKFKTKQWSSQRINEVLYNYNNKWADCTFTPHSP